MSLGILFIGTSSTRIEINTGIISHNLIFNKDRIYHPFTILKTIYYGKKKVPRKRINIKDISGQKDEIVIVTYTMKIKVEINKR